MIRREKGIAGSHTVLAVELAFIALAEEKIAVGKTAFFLRAAVGVAEEDLALFFVPFRIFR